MGCNSSRKQLPQFVLFGDSLTEWSFDDSTQGFGWYLTDLYKGKAKIVNEGYAGYTSEHVKPEFSRIMTRITAPFAPSTLLFTIFLGANDACFVGKTEYVPLPQFSDNIRSFVEEILIQDNLADAKIVLITPPPVNVPDPLPGDDEGLGPAMAKALKGKEPKQDRAYLTYMSKKRYADGIMSIAKEYEETDRVVGLNYWRALVDAGLEEQGRTGELDEDLFPGCGLAGAKEFGSGWFTDGLHLDKKAYNVLSKALTETVIGKWPELSPERIGT
ncbi:SGNH hydrolase [Paraphaeosphaeria sporulosa]|uniref:SGNH hydrolase n=1 Tax=Paraphaeosphaeria sporulosa TaxID=1460663 RepID=A0A177CRQ3_9PLEO|nr:SGNH hydrolase [Paraphaeosphaeria sporulosa]OAG10203.1 SGNH hydrolase [Paraphaeosphaeria sporulosa]